MVSGIGEGGCEMMGGGNVEEWVVMKTTLFGPLLQ